jgi:hypothetical protein
MLISFFFHFYFFPNQFCDIEKFGEFSQRIAKLVEFTMEKNYPQKWNCALFKKIKIRTHSKFRKRKSQIIYGKQQKKFKRKSSDYKKKLKKIDLCWPS